MTDSERLQEAVEGVFGSDRRRIDHARQVAAHAEALLAEEPGDPVVVMAAAWLHDIGIKEAERKYGSAAGSLQELEGPPIARAILEELDYPAPVIEDVCSIVASHHSPGEVDTANFRIVYDADWLVNFLEYYGDRPLEDKAKLIGRIFLTHAGRTRAEELFLRSKPRENE